MKIFNIFDAQLQGRIQMRSSWQALQIGIDALVIPPQAELGSKGHYTFFRTGEQQPAYSPVCGEWWACLAGELEIIPPGGERCILQRGSVFAPQVGAAHSVRALSNTTVLRAVFDDVLTTPTSQLLTYYQSFSAGHVVDWTGGINCGISARFFNREAGLGASATFTSMVAGEQPDWAAKLNYRHAEWCACFQGTLKVAWFDSQQKRELVAFIQPGMVYAPGIGEDHEISAFQSLVGLVCCFRPSLSDLAVQHDLSGEQASRY
jgi:hypothetical protein